jgi:cell division ATPase FtsA
MGKKDLDPGAVRAGTIIDKDAVEDALKEALAQVEETLGETVNQAIVGVNGALCLGLTTTVRAKRPANIPVNKREIDDIYSKIDEAAQIQAQNEYMQVTGNSEVEFDTVTRSTVYVKADNAYTNDLLDKNAGH